MFAPGQGVPEDPATGSAAGPLGAYLLQHRRLAAAREGLARLAITQGVEMGRPSQIHVEVEGAPGDIPAVHVGGACVAVGGGWFEP
jgi:trans-2,3-dihydro-3-hydroxyanthranilate isomerase